jgi:hypothetical protein
MFSYYYSARFDDGSEFVQPTNDESKMVSGKSSKFDFMKMAEGRKLEVMFLEGYPHKVSINHPEKNFVLNGRTIRPGDSLPEDLEWIELRQDEEVHGPYFRRVKRFYNVELQEVGCELQYCVGIPGEKYFLAVR